MQRSSRLLIPALSVLLIGCDRNSKSAPTAKAPALTIIDPTTEPATLPSASTVSVAPVATTQEVASATAIAGEPSFMMIDQKRVTFPPGKLRVTDKSGRVVATLFSDDPKEAIDDTYAGNSFYFEMPLTEAPDVANFAQAGWRASASPGDTEDTPYGVFLNGHKQQLQPLDVKVDFQAMSSEVTIVWISGRFQLVDIQDDGQKQPPKQVSLAAKVVAKTTLK